ncbi:uncharacterized protein G2W53_006234 [Senna tora]|uniref:Uncharacterized protein n=1 Tax=Senna tora TaxID=362788 RepID=A0A835CG97_9FABA|nr:uncharacterized protein G2W53_006234 [Senna tora]
MGKSEGRWRHAITSHRNPTSKN